VALSFIDTATQRMPRSAVLDSGRDPQPSKPYSMSHPSFVLEWPDRRILLIDAGMTEEGARAFGKPLEIAAGAAPIEPHGSVATRLGERRKDVAGIVFTHLHTDHVEGVSELCVGRTEPLPVFLTPTQAGQANYTTRPGRNLLDRAGCLRLVELEGGPLLSVPGFPGVHVIAAAGHTPGSQVILAKLGGGDERAVAFTGDITNALDGILFDVPKPWLYSLLMVPEDGERLGQVRRWLRDLHTNGGVTLLVAHDGRALEAAELPSWQPG
jgi:glyoxylase-like metal-dependent hydrolase (beta-lactamase superfamily II)